MAAKRTLIIIGVLYLLSASFCTLMFESAAEALGYLLPDAAGQGEFITVYGGLQAGIGLAMILSALRNSAIDGGLLFAAVLSAVLAAYRLVASLVMVVPIAAWAPYFVLEAVLAAILIWAWHGLARSL